MQVFEIKLKVFLLKDIDAKDAQKVVAAFVDRVLSKNKKLLEFHEKNMFKNYCFNAPYPLEKDKVYKNGKIYTIVFRTIDKKLAQLFNGRMVNEYDNEIKALTAEIKIIPKRQIERIYSITPMVIKNDSGYWKNEISFQEFEKRFRENLIKKYNQIMNTKIDEDFQLYTNIQFNNKTPIPTAYKNITILGDKVTLYIADNNTAQDIAYMCLGTAIGTMNARGYGFVNYQYLKN